MSAQMEVRFPELPAFTSASPLPPYEGNDGTVIYGFEGADTNAANAYRAALSELGFTKVFENKINALFSV